MAPVDTAQAAMKTIARRVIYWYLSGITMVARHFAPCPRPPPSPLHRLCHPRPTRRRCTASWPVNSRRIYAVAATGPIRPCLLSGCWPSHWRCPGSRHARPLPCWWSRGWCCRAMARATSSRRDWSRRSRSSPGLAKSCANVATCRPQPGWCARPALQTPRRACSCSWA
jgi:hypothetical protein